MSNDGKDPVVETETLEGEPIEEMIGRVSLLGLNDLYSSRVIRKSVDETIPDYVFWDKFRRGKATGYKLGSLFAKRIERVFSRWLFSKGVDVVLDVEDLGGEEGGLGEKALAYTNLALDAFITNLLGLEASEGDEELTDLEAPSNALLLQIYEDHLGLGDQYIIVNVDGSLSVPSPDTVKVVRDELDYRLIVAVEVTTITKKYIITDRYEAAQRTLTIKEGTTIVFKETFANLIGVIPVVHVAWGRSANETNGHSYHEPLLPLFDEYDDVIFKQMDGAKLLGNPLLTFEGMEDINQVININEPTETETYTDRDGNEEERKQLKVDTNAILLVGAGGSAKFTAPPVGFTADTTQALKSLFLLILDHTGIPEFIWGNELSSARASAEVQMDQWVQDITGMQRMAGGWILKLCALWLRFKALMDPQLVIGTLALQWSPIIEKNETLRLEQIKFANLEHLITDATALRLLNIVDDPDKEVAEAKVEADKQYDERFPDGDTQNFRDRLESDEDEKEED